VTDAVAAVADRRATDLGRISGFTSIASRRAAVWSGCPSLSGRGNAAQGRERYIHEFTPILRKLASHKRHVDNSVF